MMTRHSPARTIAYWADRAEKAEEERDEARATKNMHKERAQQALADLDRAEARIKAVRDVLDQARDESERPNEAAIRRALDG